MQKSIIYTLVSHIPDQQGWFDRCGDYHKGKESTIRVQYFLEENAAIEALALCLVENSDGFNQLLVNGVAQYEIPQDWTNSETQSIQEYASFLEEVHSKIDDQVFTKSLELQEEQRIKNIEKKEAEKIQKAKEEALKVEKQNQAEKELLKELLKKHGSA